MALTYGQVTAITHDLIKDKMSEGVFNSNKVLMRLREKQELEEGGNKILLPLMVADESSSTGAFYDRADALSLDEYDGISSSEWDWKQIYESVVIYKTDIAKNSGRLGVLKLIDKKVRQGELAMTQRLMKAILAGSTSKELVGLDSIVAASGTVGNIAPADYSRWVSYVDGNGGTARALTQAIIDKAYDQTVEEGIGGATFGFMNKAVFSKFKGLLTGQQRVTREDTVSGQGHKGQVIVYNGIDHMIENNLTANEIFYIDENHYKLHVHKDHNMRRQSIKDLETADALLERIFLYCAACTNERRFNSKVQDIAVQ